MTTLQSTSVQPDNYFDDQTYLSSSSLANFVSFDIYGTPTYNYMSFLFPGEVKGDAVKIGSLADACITEGKILSDLIGQKMSKDDLLDECDARGVDYPRQVKDPSKPASNVTIDLLRALLVKDGFKFKEEVADKIFYTTQRIIDRANELQYDRNTTLAQYIAESETQVVLTSDELWMKGKPDIINVTRKRCTDLKTCGNLDILMKALTFRGEINIFHKYTRQLAIYRRLIQEKTGELFDMELMVIAHSGKPLRIAVSHEALDLAWAQIEKDIAELIKYGSEEEQDYALKLTFTPKEPGVPLQNALGDLEEEEEIDEEDAIDKNF
jgi:hypothetical protein